MSGTQKVTHNPNFIIPFNSTVPDGVRYEQSRSKSSADKIRRKRRSAIQMGDRLRERWPERRWKFECICSRPLLVGMSSAATARLGVGTIWNAEPLSLDESCNSYDAASQKAGRADFDDAPDTIENKSDGMN